MQDIIVLDYLLNQTKKQKMDLMVVNRVNNELQNLNKLKKQGYGKVIDYLRNQNGKQLKGAENLWKYRLSDGDRIIYTYGSYLPWINSKYADSLVIVAYSKHDDQGHEGSLKKQKFYTVDRIEEVFGMLVSCEENDVIKLNEDDVKICFELLSEEFSKNHTAYVVDPNKIVDTSLLDVNLSKEQDNYINSYILNQKPTFVCGGAGTGKTIMAIHIMLDYRSSNHNKKIAYFTQSDELKNKIKSRYDYIYCKKFDLEEDLDTDFNNLNYFCRRKVEIIDKNFVKTDEFMNWINSQSDLLKELKKKKIELLPLWAEIRGVIKGALNDSWCRTKPQDRQSYAKDIIDELNEKNLINWEKDGRHFTVDPNKKINKNLIISEESLREYKKLVDYYQGVDSSMKNIGYEEYLNISPERSVLDPSLRECAYKIYLEYQKWLNIHKLYDENDLILKCINEIKDSDKYDMIVIDEIQDYTELQILFLKNLVKKTNCLVMAGDPHQNINPTVFSESRLGMLLRGELRRFQLTENFRCQKEIVQYANGLAKIRNRVIGKTNNEHEESSVKKETDINHVIKLQSNKSNIDSLVKTLSQYPDAALLVTNDKEKEYLAQFLPQNEDNLNNIFTMSEIKGMEYRYVVCSNIVSSYNSIWNSIFNSNIAKKQSRFRYYFNMFYVGLTRAQETLVIVENNECSEFYNELQENSNTKIHNVSDFSIENLNISILSKDLENYLSQAKNYEEQGMFEQAIVLYKKSNSSEDVINRCQMKLFAKNKEYVDALRLAFILNNSEALDQYAFECDEDDQDSDEFWLADIYLHPEKLLDGEDYDHVDVKKLIKQIFQKNDYQNVYDFFKLRFEKILNSLMKEEKGSGK